MADPRFFRRSGPIALGEIARFVGGALSQPGSADFMIRDIAALEYAVEGDITVLSDRRYLSVLGDRLARVLYAGLLGEVEAFGDGESKEEASC